MTTADPADLLALLTRASTTQVQPMLTGMGEPGGNVRYGQGRILTWSQSTFNNTIAYRGGVLENLPVLSGPDALTYRPNDTVAIMSWSPNGGASVHWIMGRVIVPGPGRGEEAIEWMTTELGRRIAAAVFADRIHADHIDNQGSLTTENTWIDSLDFAGSPSPGPSINMEITESGRAIVFVGAHIQVLDGETGWMTCRVDDEPNPFSGSSTAVVRCPQGIVSGLGVASVGISLIEGLDAGIHEFKASYMATDVVNPTGIKFSDRIILGMGF